ncbi:MAG: aminotransferase class V-fold PLP-dependent enzyme [Xanthobacter sp.]
MSIYLNAGSHGLPAHPTLMRLSQELQSEMEHGVVQATALAMPELAATKDRAAHLLGASEERTSLGFTTTQSWLSIVSRLPLHKRRIVICPHEWGANVRHLQHLASLSDLRITLIPEEEAFDPAAWAQRMDEDVAALFLPQVTSIEALHYPVAAIGAAPRPEHTLLIVDAAQALGRVRVSMADLNCDVVLGTARKWLRGPRSTALMALSPRAEKAIGTATGLLEPADFSIPSRCALGVALGAFLETGLSSTAARISALEHHLRNRLDQVGLGNGLRLLPKRENVHHAPGTITLALPLAQQKTVDHGLKTAHITAKWANPAGEEPLSHRARMVDTAFLRITPHIYNSERELDQIAACLCNQKDG